MNVYRGESSILKFGLILYELTWQEKESFKQDTSLIKQIYLKKAVFLTYSFQYCLMYLCGAVDTVQVFLIKLDMIQCTHLVKISIFSLNNVTVRLTKIMNNRLEHIKILIFSHFSVLNIGWIFPKKNLILYNSILDKETNFYQKINIHTYIFKVLYFLKMCPIFVWCSGRHVI